MKSKIGEFKMLDIDDLAMFGCPLDQNSSYMRGARFAPKKIREALHCGSANYCAENGYDLEKDLRFKDVGDIEIQDGFDSFARIERFATEILEKGAIPLCLGGDHSITYPLVKALTRNVGQFSILHFDAHPDLYDEFEGNQFSHACPFSRIMEDGIVKELVQVGIRTLNPHQRAQAEKFGVRIIEAKEFSCDIDLNISGPVYISLDMDVFDPAFAPGISHYEPGGLTPRNVINLLQRLDNPVIGADLVEYNPERDFNGMTAMLAAKLLNEIAALVLR